MATKLYATITILSEEGPIYKAKNTKLNTVIEELNEILHAKVSPEITIAFVIQEEVGQA